MTGESRHVAKGVGSAVIAGSINLDGALLIRSSGAGTATRWAQICRSVRDALARRSPTQRLADRVVGVSVPLVLVLGALTVIWWAHSVPFDRALLVGLGGAGGGLSLRGGSRRAARDFTRHRAAGPVRLPRPRSRCNRDPGGAHGCSPSTRPAH